MASKTNDVGAFFRAFFRTVPERVRGIARELAVSLLIFLLGFIVAWMLIEQDTTWYDAFVDPALAGGRNPHASREFLKQILYGNGEGLGGFASFLFVHNAQIGIVCFALGFAAGVPTAYALFTNGAMLGAFSWIYADKGLSFELWGWLLPHGVPEIGAVILCGACGLKLGQALLFPGELSIRDAFARSGRHVAPIVVACIGLFAYAGFVEGVFRQVVQDEMTRYAVATGNTVMLGVWLLYVGTARERGGTERISIPTHEEVSP